MTDNIEDVDGAASDITDQKTDVKLDEQVNTDVDNGQKEPDSDKDTSENAEPVAYSDFTFPEGVEPDAALLEKATPLMQEFGLDQDNAQKAVDFIAELRQQDAQAAVDTHQQQVKDWTEQSKNHEEYGGEKFEENLGIAKNALDKLGTPEFSELLIDTGFGNHPALIGVFYKVGLLLAEDNPGGGSDTPNPKLTRAQRMYPDSNT